MRTLEPRYCSEALAHQNPSHSSRETAPSELSQPLSSAAQLQEEGEINHPEEEDRREATILPAG